MWSPSILDSDFTDIKNTLLFLENEKADFVHLDIMDGNFVPNITFGPKIIKWFRPCTKLPFDAHLMIEKPERYIDNFIEAGCDYITFHTEATNNTESIIDRIIKAGKKPGLSIKPGTGVEAVIPFIHKLSMILVMSVEPGFGGQKFMENMLDKVKTLRSIIDKNALPCLIEIDGGINTTTAPLARSAGVDVFVAGNAIFGAPDKIKAFNLLKESVK